MLYCFSGAPAKFRGNDRDYQQQHHGQQQRQHHPDQHHSRQGNHGQGGYDNSKGGQNYYNDSNKRKNSNSDSSHPPGKYQKYNKPEIIQLSAVKLGDDEEDPLGTTTILDHGLSLPKILADPRVSNLPLYNPGHMNISAFKPLKNNTVTATWVGEKCGGCKLGPKGHSISDHNVVVVGDQFLPPNIGSQGECVPVGRIESATFEHVKLFLQAQKEAGFSPPQGSILCVSLTRYVCVVGSDLYWQEFDSFCKWIYKEFRMTSVPFFTPFPKDLSGTQLVRLHQAMSAARARYLGDFRGAVDWRYALWKPLTDFLTKKKIGKKIIPTPPVVLGNVIVQCPPSVWLGIEGDFSETLPPPVEEEFFKDLLKHLQSVRPQKILFECPSEEAFIAGFDKTPAKTAAADNSDVPTVHIYGSSIMKAAVEGMEYLASKHPEDVFVMNHCQEDTNDIAIMCQSKFIPEKKHEDDCIVLLFLGNEALKHEKHKKFGGNYHYWNPKFLDDQGVNEMIQKASTLISNIQKKFQGPVYLLGPMPRLIVPCCKSSTHAVKQSPIFQSNLQYFFLLNKFLCVHPAFSGKKVDFIPYDKIFGVNFCKDDLSDGVHLAPAANIKLCEFIVNLPLWKTKKAKALLNPQPSFFTWAENVLNSAQKMAKNKKAPLTSTPRQPAASGGQSGPVGDDPAVSPITNPNAMDTAEKSSSDNTGQQPEAVVPAGESSAERRRSSAKHGPDDLPEYNSEDEAETEKNVCETLNSNPDLLADNSAKADTDEFASSEEEQEEGEEGEVVEVE